MRKCCERAAISRGVVTVILLFLASGPVPNAPFGTSRLRAEEPILPPDAAVRAYEAGREAVKRRDYVQGVKKLQEALATGHVRAAEHFGTSRNFTDWYDPYYWLGVAYMELGNDSEARRNLERSRGAGVIERWPEFADLVDRLATLQRHDEERRLQLQIPTPIPTPTPTPGPPPTPFPTPLEIRTPELVEPTAPPVTPPRPVESADLERVLQPLSSGNWAAAQAALARLRARSPDGLEGDLLETLLYGTRYLVEGRRDDGLLGQARRSLANYRRKGGPKKAEESWLSPALLAVLNGS